MGRRTQHLITLFAAIGMLWFLCSNLKLHDEIQGAHLFSLSDQFENTLDNDNEAMEELPASLHEYSYVSQTKLNEGSHNKNIENVHVEPKEELTGSAPGPAQTVSKVPVQADDNKRVGIIDSHGVSGNNQAPSDVYVFNPEEYDLKLKNVLKPHENVTSAAYKHIFWAGFCNQYMMFIGVIILAHESNYSQLLIEGLRWKDTYGTNQHIRHDMLFDVVHWNSYYPLLPRIVSHNSTILPDVSIGGSRISPKIQWEGDSTNATAPYAIGKKQTSAVFAYQQYDQQVFKKRKERYPFEVEIMKDAFRPHPEIQKIIDDFLQSIDNGNSSFMVLHARVEPDMQKHSQCLDLKVKELKDIIDMVEAHFQDPPFTTLIIILNREILEKEVAKTDNKNMVAVENLKVLNDYVRNGAWGGKVNVVEAGSKLAEKHDTYSKYSTITGGIINFFISLQANIFVGTEVSSYSAAVAKSRFFRERRDSFFYTPKGINLATEVNSTDAPKFHC